MSTSLPAGQGPYQSGNPITLEAQFVSGTSPVDPATVVFNIRDADNDLTTYTYGVDSEVVRSAEGLYLCNLPNPWLPGQSYYEAVATNPDVTLPGEFYVIPSSVIPPAQAPGPKLPPGTSWIAGEDLVGGLGSSGASAVTLDAVAVMASMLMFELSGRQFVGICGPVTVRPPTRAGYGGLGGFAGWGGFGDAWFSWGYWQGSWGWGPGVSWGDDSSDFRRLASTSSVDLSGYPVSEVTQVKIDGAVLPTTFSDSGAPTYRLDQWRYLTRLSDPSNPTDPLYWPPLQRGDLDDDQPGTWSITYRYGVAPPPLGIEAAKQIAQQMLLAISGEACQLPPNVRTIVRQGATIERVTALAPELRVGGTGLFLVDSFIAAYNPYGLRRKPSIWSPDTTYPVRVGNE